LSYVATTISYEIASHDPDGTFVDAVWGGRQLPRKGETVMLPDGNGINSYQEMEVVEVVHFPHKTTVWLGGSDGWENGSVTKLFKFARAEGYRLV